MSLVFAIGRWVFSMSLSLSRVVDEEEEVPPLSSELELAFGFQPDADEEDDD